MEVEEAMVRIEQPMVKAEEVIKTIVDGSTREMRLREAKTTTLDSQIEALIPHSKISGRTITKKLRGHQLILDLVEVEDC